MRPTHNRRFLTCRLCLLGALISLSLTFCRKEAPPPPTPQPQVQTKSAPTPSPWLVLSSYLPEAQELRQRASIQTDTSWEGRPVSTGWIVDPIVIAYSGQGADSAVAATKHLIERYHPYGIVFTGISAPMNTAHILGDLIIPDRWMMDTQAAGQGSARAAAMPVDTAIARALGKAADESAFHLRAVYRRLPEIHKGGTGLSGIAAIDTRARREQVRKATKAEVYDHESAAVVQAAGAAGVPVVVLRACSAPAGAVNDQATRDALDDFLGVTARNTMMVVQRFLETRPERKVM